MNVAYHGLVDRQGRLGASYKRVYDALCGRHPDVRPWHFQWLAVKDLYRDLRQLLPILSGRVLDVGCGDKPYAAWMTSASEVVGMDVAAGPKVDVVVDPAAPWPFEAGSFDSILCTQVVEHVADLDLFLAEVGRVLRPGGTLLLTVPFIYNEHGSPSDFRRFSRHGLRAQLARGFEVVELHGQGAVGSTIGVVALNWMDATLDLRRTTRLLKGLFLPLWIAVGAVVNVAGALVDEVDSTGFFYGNVLVLARKRTPPPEVSA